MGEYDDIWEAHGPDEFGDFSISSKGEKLAKCVVVQNGFRTPEETAAIAKRLITAVNSHADLVKALEECRKRLQMDLEEIQHLRGWLSDSEAAERADQDELADQMDKLAIFAADEALAKVQTP